MKIRSKRYREALKQVEAERLYKLRDAIGILKQLPHTKFDESVDLNFQVGIDPAQTDQSVRFAVNLPHGSGKQVRVLCLCQGEDAKAAKGAGAEHVGAEELIEKVAGGWMDFDVVIAHPGMMKSASKLGRVLGPRGLMPSPKAGTVTAEISKAVQEVKRGKVELKNDKTAGIHVSIGKVSFEESALMENAKAIVKALLAHKPSASRGDFLRRVSVSSTHGPGIRLEVASLTT